MKLTDVNCDKGSFSNLVIEKCVLLLFFVIHFCVLLRFLEFKHIKVAHKGAGEGGVGAGQVPLPPFLRGQGGQSAFVFYGTLLFNNVRLQIMKTMNVTLKSRNHRNLH